MVLADATPPGKKKSQKLSDKKRNKSRPARRDAESIVPSLTSEIQDTNFLKQSKKKRKNVDSISQFHSNDKKDASEECNGKKIIE